MAIPFKAWYEAENMNMARNIFHGNELQWGRLPRRKNQRRRRQAHAFIAGLALCGKGYNNEIALYSHKPTGLLCAKCVREVATRILQSDAPALLSGELGSYENVRFIKTHDHAGDLL